MDLLQEIIENLQIGEDERVVELTRKALEQNISAADILEKGLIAGMGVVGEKFKTREFFLPDVLLAAKAMNRAMEEIGPLLMGARRAVIGKIVIGTVQGDLHDIGKNLVGIMLKGAGIDVVDLGNDVPPEKFVAVAKQENAKVIGMSALLLNTMPIMQKVMDILKQEGLSGQIKTIVGGAPVSRDFAAQIGADAYGYDAANAVEQVKKLLQGA